MSLGALGGTRTPGLLLRRQLLYPAELLAHIYAAAADDGAGDGNRTHVTSLEGWNSTIELHPQGPRGIMQLQATVLYYQICAPLSTGFFPIFSRFSQRGQGSGEKRLVRPWQGP